MRELFKSFSDKAIRNAIGGFLLFILLLFSALNEDKMGQPLYFLLILIPLFWLLIGLDLRKKYKVFPEDYKCNSNLIKGNKIMDLIFFVLIVIAWIFRTKKMAISGYLFGLVFILYSAWIIYKWREITRAAKLIE
jgi:uncharacterized membrane protein